MTVSIIVNAISMGIIFLYGCVGEIFTERAGHLNLGIPGIMCIGAAGGAYAISIFGEKVNGVLLVILAIIFSMLFSAVPVKTQYMQRYCMMMGIIRTSTYMMIPQKPRKLCKKLIFLTSGGCGRLATHVWNCRK